MPRRQQSMACLKLDEKPAHSRRSSYTTDPRILILGRAFDAAAGSDYSFIGKQFPFLGYMRELRS
jgi:hypothetical protein